MVTRFIIGCVFLNFFLFLNAQNNLYPQDYGSPMVLPIELSGSFSELRGDHFHTGVDIRVVNRPHRKVYSIGDGWVSRIKVEPAGYGNALYITHPEGYVSVYAHFDFFTKEIAALVKTIQYRKKNFHIDESFPKDSLPVKKGEVIGIAGNSGFSFGAHLHFEIREEITEEPIDPLLFGLVVKDIIPPVFRQLKIYSHGTSTVNGKMIDVMYSTVKQSNGKYALPTVPVVSGAISFGFDVNDKQNYQNPNRLGLKTLCVWVDDSLFLDIRFDRLNFDVLRHQLAFIDYPERGRSSKRFQRTWKRPGNHLPIYYFIKDDGILYLDEERIYRIKCDITDINDHRSELLFSVKSVLGENHDFSVQCKDGWQLFQRDSLNIWKGEQTEVIMDSNALFSDLCFRIREYETPLSNFAPAVDVLCDDASPGFFKVRIKPDHPVDTLDGLVIVRVGEKNKLSGITTTDMGAYFEGRTRSFGTFALVQDIRSPVIRPIQIPVSGLVSNFKRISFKVTDDICGIADYNAWINGEWVLLEYHLKDDLMFYIIDDKMPVGESEFKIIVTDRCGNSAEWKQMLKR